MPKMKESRVFNAETGKFDVTFEGVTRSAWGQKIKPLKFTGTYVAYAAFQQLVDDKRELSADEQLSARNTAIKNNARQMAMEKAWKDKGYKKLTAENDPQTRLKEMIELLVLSGKYTKNSAQEFAEKALGISLEAEKDFEEDEDEDETENGAA